VEKPRNVLAEVDDAKRGIAALETALHSGMDSWGTNSDKSACPPTVVALFDRFNAPVEVKINNIFGK
jgi:hypothetical protein